MLFGTKRIVDEEYLEKEIDKAKSDYCFKISEYIKNISFHDSVITKYEKKGNEIIMEFINDFSRNNLIRIIFKEVIVSDDTDFVDVDIYR